MVIGKDPKRQADLFQVTIATNLFPNGPELGYLGCDHQRQQNNDSPHCNPPETSQRTAPLALIVSKLLTRVVALFLHFTSFLRRFHVASPARSLWVTFDGVSFSALADRGTMPKPSKPAQNNVRSKETIPADGWQRTIRPR